MEKESQRNKRQIDKIKMALDEKTKELEEERYNLKNLVTGEEQTLSPERIVSYVLDQRRTVIR